LGVCLTNLLFLASNIDAYLDTAVAAQFEFISLARLHEYLSVPQEKTRFRPKDRKYRSFVVRLSRRSMGELACSIVGDTVEVRRNGVQVLTALAGDSSLVAADKAAPQLLDLCPTCPDLLEADSWHQIVAVNDVTGSAEAMALELCRPAGEPLLGVGAAREDVVLEVSSGWLQGGVRVEIEHLKAGYADLPTDVLKGISLTIEKKSKVAIAGKTGCGKSSLLLVLLRILEPRAGKVLLNGVDTCSVGLATLRGAVGLLPQDPVVFSGTLKHNLDPLGIYSDGRIWQALRCAHLAEVVEQLPLGLLHEVSDEGSDLSFGQRQLVCLARMVLRRPGLLLLDEATSAMDPRTQQLVQHAMRSSFPDSTLVAVAHRLETVLDFDHIVVLEHGTVVEHGPVKELADRQGGFVRGMLQVKVP